MTNLTSFLNELGELSRKHKLALSGPSVVFEMELEDMGTEYFSDDESVVTFGKSARS